ncbi:MAG: hypothetical protein EBS55_04875 [Flavobacteriaceae bacterium]|nr:hypothetical protein [Flavobacteriaceae bacterium]
MLTKVVYFYEVKSTEDTIRIIVRNNFGQREFVLSYSNKTSIETELSTLKNRLDTTGLYRNGLFYPKTSSMIIPVMGNPVRKK